LLRPFGCPFNRLATRLDVFANAPHGIAGTQRKRGEQQGQ